ncbi:MAG: type II toxin-antitoxin system VapC family toxin [Chthoniobacterales bacterium]
MILDTCALLFLASGDKRLSRAAREGLRDAPARWFCAISAYEIALKYQKAKLQLPIPLAQWVEEVARRYVLTEAPLDSALCCAAASLPAHHRGGEVAELSGRDR